MQNTLIVKTHCFLSNFFGTVFLIYGGIWYLALLFVHSDYLQTMKQAMLILPGVFFVSGQTNTPGWILRKGEFIIYIAIIIRILGAIWVYSTGSTACFSGSCSLSASTQKPTVATIIELTVFFVRILIMFGVAQSLRAMGYSAARKSVDSN
jgi:hypothetical protein